MYSGEFADEDIDDSDYIEPPALPKKTGPKYSYSREQLLALQSVSHLAAAPDCCQQCPERPFDLPELEVVVPEAPALGTPQRKCVEMDEFLRSASKVVTCSGVQGLPLGVFCLPSLPASPRWRCLVSPASRWLLCASPLRRART